jgi:molybdate transport system substrate-binding protein
MVPLAPEDGLRDTLLMKISLQIKRLICALLIVAGCCGGVQAGDVTVFAAASLKEALDEVARDYSDTSGQTITTSFAGSSALARQIEFGAPADIFISANTDWMDRLEKTGGIVTESRFDLLGNRLVLIGRTPLSTEVAISGTLDLVGMLQGGRLAMALTDAVPAGIYGKAALQHLGLWDDVASAVAETDNVRAALALVALGAAPLGIVYATDAKAEPRVATLGVFPASSHPEITYPVATTPRGQRAEVSSFLDYLRSDAAHDVFEAHGFLMLAE